MPGCQRVQRGEKANRTVLENAVFTRCEECPSGGEHAPIWQIKATKVTRDLEEEVVEYENAMVEMFGVPVLYTPYFYHPDPTVDRKSGLLAPVFGASGELGQQYTQPVYLVIDDQSDVTLSPRVTSKEGVVMAGEYRQRFADGFWVSDGSITYVDQVDVQNRKTGDDELRGHLRSTGRFRLDEQFGWGFDFFRTSDDTYLRRYDIHGGTLVSRAFLTGFNGRHFAGLEAFAFQGLRNGDKEGDTPFVLPLATFQASGEPAGLGGRLDVAFNGVGLQRTGGRDVRRLSFDGSWSRQFVDGFGGLTTAGLHLRADGYNVSEAQDTDVTASGTTISKVASGRWRHWTGACRWSVGAAGSARRWNPGYSSSARRPVAIRTISRTRIPRVLSLPMRICSAATGSPDMTGSTAAAG